MTDQRRPTRFPDAKVERNLISYESAPILNPADVHLRITLDRFNYRCNLPSWHIKADEQPDYAAAAKEAVAAADALMAAWANRKECKP